ncbi:NAD(P)-dependent oxidoreductase [Pseudodesulfovibrio piezophilus]|uniref:Putative D-isomer specific 2-hydroxyacid dehydrogenase NAD-binding n=1 Tax=Pseudodesulfovibrio piezophilus (strain DSM 21447 / JCM 15486 / C1TLV30) TaxID=1322246 RepID=M1WKN6_PSEP2|nr:NAD(P)-dependent oxidoreductase [Pseudodesulfovibrio piezophilus]CCH49916.1 putative D-isomer specific 2-hydroxyacid dehydrogenase NAD-binding [Pseudodesulfovibrio piezophilus C1TLV30]
MKIVNVEAKGYSPKAEQALRELGDVHMTNADYSMLLTLVEDADVLIVRLKHLIDEKILKRAKRLKVIVTATTGLDHIDLEAARMRGITVLSLKGEQDFLQNITATAELTWGLLLSLVRRLPAAMRHVNMGGWDRDAFRGNELKGKVLGVLGFGRLGKMVAEYGRIFRMEVLTHDPYVDRLPDYVTSCSLNSLLENSDVVSVHLPLNNETCGLLGSREFDSMKRGALFINTSRGEIMQEEALRNAILNKHLGGAGLDVLTSELSESPDWINHSPLIQLARENYNVVITPHIGGATMESMESTELFMVNKLKMKLESLHHS